MGLSYRFWVGLMAGVISYLAYIPYVLSTLRGKSHPNRATWLIWFVVSLILLTSYKTLGATNALWLSVANTLGMGGIVFLSFRYGNGGFSKLDLSCLAAALLGIVLWFIFDSPMLALFISLGIDAVGAIPTLRKAYFKPESEDYQTWLMFWAGNSLNLLALDAWRPSMSIYPFYLFCISGVMVLILTLRKSKK